MNEVRNNCNAYDNKQNMITEDVQSVFERNIGKYAYVELRNYNMFIIIRNVDKRNNVFNYDFLNDGIWKPNYQSRFNSIIRYNILDTIASGFVDEPMNNINNNYCIN